jgi:NADPH-dependent glutamate synthase beta subunit-like oxidoreductase
MACGGIRNWRDAAEMILCGADLVGICAETLISGFGFIEGLIADLKNYMQEHGYGGVRDMRDIVVPLVKSAPDLTLYKGYAQIKEPGLAAPCKAACPHHVPAQAYVQKVAKRDFRAAYDLITAKSPLQSVCGWVCSRRCEDECTRGEIGTPVPIRAIKRFVLEYGGEMGWKPELKKAAAKTEKAAVIGSGPAGLSCAYYLALAGYQIAVFESERALGGMLRYAIPRFRLSRDVLDEEIEGLKALGIAFVTGKAFGRDMTAGSLKADGYRAVFVGVGAQENRQLGIPGEDAEGVIPALTFLRGVYDGRVTSAGKRVVVLGGGFSAVDSARTAKRLGAQEVYVAYRRTKDEMPATAGEVAEAEAEGVRFMYLVAPESVIAKDGRAVGVSMVNQVLGCSDDSGRRRPEQVSGARFELMCDMIIPAIGQRPEPAAVSELALDRAGMAVIDPATGATNIEGVFSGGDAANVDTAIAAIAAGKRAACSIDRYISGENAMLEYEPEYPAVSKEQVLRRSGWFKDGDPVGLETRNGAERSKGFDNYIRALTQEEAVSEAKRCLNCGCGEGCGLCAQICGEFAVHLKAPDTWEIGRDECAACGMCYNRCPNKNISIVDTHETVK